ncbi:MAG TPA: hypothetical protein IAB58_04375 [Candidatus Pelethosoma merdigallinarum]|nr:hypothetical protein [Candidatus Pelethosoma merdigallinarum]
MRTRKKQRIIIGTLCAIVIGLTVGYAVLSQTLNIQGTGGITTDWRIEITNVETKKIVGNAKNVTDPSFDKLTANMSASFEKPGDSISYDITVSNLGNIDAVLDSIKMSMEEQEYIDFKIEGITAREELIVDQDITFQLIMKLSENIPDIPSNQSFDFSMNLNYLQSGNSSNFSEATEEGNVDELSITNLTFEPSENSIKTIITATNAIKYYYSLDNNKWYETTSNEYTIYQLDTHKEYTIYVKAEDSLGNVVFSSGKVSTTDETDPKVTITLGNNVMGNNGWYKGLTLDSTITDNVGIKEVKYCETTETSCEPTTPLEGQENVYSVNLSSNSLPTRLCVKAIDTSNNETTKCSDLYKVDSTIPTIYNFNVTPNDDTVTLEVTGVDNESGVNKYFYSKDGGQSFVESNNSNYTFTSLEEKDYLMSVYVEDKAGNKSEINTKSTTIKHKSWCEKNGVTDLADCLLASETKNTNIEEAKQTIKDKGTPDFKVSAPAITYEEVASTNTSTVSTTTYWQIGTGYTFDSSTGYYTLTGSSLQDPSSIDYSNGNYYTCTSTNSSCTVMRRITKVTTSTNSNGGTTYTATVYNYTAGIKGYDNSGTGMYASTDNAGDTFYYRGAVGGNYVKFGDYYWRIIRINGDGSIRMIYDGKTPHENGESSSDRQVGTSAFNSYWADNAYVGYMYGDTSNNQITESIQSFDYNGLSPTTKYYFGTTYTYDSSTRSFKLSGDLVQATPKEYREKYNTNNYYTCISSNETATCQRLLHVTSGVNDTTLRVKGIEYSSTSYESAHKNDANSTMKTYLENWYNNNLKSYDNKISKEAIYCNNRVPSTKVAYPYTQEGYGIHSTIYDYDKFWDWQGTRKGPNLICSRNNDQFSVSSTSGNGKLTNPIGLITADEVNIAGGRTNAQNRLYYLYSGTNYWTMSPSGFSYWFRASEFYVSSPGVLTSNNVDYAFGVRPVINIDPSKITFTGTGTMQDPYVVE